MMGMLRESLRRRFGEEFLAMARGGGDENFLLALGDVGGSPNRSLLFWLLAKNNSRDLRRSGIHSFQLKPWKYVRFSDSHFGIHAVCLESLAEHTAPSK